MLERGLPPEVLASLAWWVLCAGALFIAAAAVLRARRGVHALLVGLAGLWFVWGLGVAPIANDTVSAAAVMREANRIAGADGEVVLLAWKEQNLLMAPRPMHDVGFRQPPAVQLERATPWLAQDPQRRWAFARHAALKDCLDPARVSVVGRSNRIEWVMFRHDALRPGCAPASPDDGDDTD